MNPIELGFWIAFWVMIGIPAAAMLVIGAFALLGAVAVKCSELWAQKKDGPDEA